MKWFKFYGQDYLSDPKMLSLSSSERSCWITLLCYSSVNDNGMITFLSEQQLMLQAGLDFTCDEWDRTIGILKKLEKLEMITDDNGKITVLNWGKRQETSLTSYERVKRYREKKRNDNTSDNAMITLEENRREENRINTTARTIEIIGATQSWFDIFWKKYPNKKSRKKASEIWVRIFSKVKGEGSYQLYENILKGLESSCSSDQWKKDGGQFIPHPTTWLNQARWEDEVEIETLPEKIGQY